MPSEEYIRSRLSVMEEFLESNWAKREKGRKSISGYSLDALRQMYERGIALELAPQGKTEFPIHTTKCPRISTTRDTRGNPIMIFNGFTNVPHSTNILDKSWSMERYGKGLPSVINPYNGRLAKYGISFVVKQWLYWCNDNELSYNDWSSSYRKKFGQLHPRITIDNLIEMLEDLRELKDERGRYKFNPQLIDHYLEQLHHSQQFISPELLGYWTKRHTLEDWWHEDGMTYAYLKVRGRLRKGEKRRKVVTINENKEMARVEVESKLYIYASYPVNYMWPEKQSDEYGTPEDERAMDRKNFYESLDHQEKTNKEGFARALQKYKDLICRHECPHHDDCDSYCQKAIKKVSQLWNKFKDIEKRRKEGKKNIITKKREKRFRLPRDTDVKDTIRRTRSSTRKKKIPIEVKRQILNTLIIGRDLIDFGKCAGEFQYSQVQKMLIFVRKAEKWDDIVDRYIQLRVELEDGEIDKKWYRYLMKELKTELPDNQILINGERLNFWEILWDILENDYKKRACEDLINVHAIDLNDIHANSEVAEVGGFKNFLVAQQGKRQRGV